jgi:aminomethyltransferase
MRMPMKRTALYDEHVSRGGKMVPFAGWDMPIQFTSIIEEHMSVRNGCGVFDVSHMGDLVVRGGGAREAVDRLITNDLEGAPVGRCVYGHILREDGTILDDTIATPLSGDEVLVVPNAATTERVREWFKGHLGGSELLDLSDSISTIAVQGPTAADAVGGLTSADLSGLGSFRAVFATLDKLGPAEGGTHTPLLEGRAGLDG